MIADLEPYAAMKDSGVEWLGHVPEHWDVTRLRFLAHINTGGRDTIDRRDDGAYPFFVRSQTVERIDSYSFDGEAVLTAGDGAGVAKVFHYVTNGKFDYHQRVYKFSNFRALRGRFFFRYFGSTLRFEAFRETAKSTVDSLRLPMLQNFPIPVPPSNEQSMIIRFLDHADRRIRRYIRAKQKLIKLLEEQKQVIIHRAVTRGLDPNVRLKPSGVEWLGDVPRHWEVRLLHHLLDPAIPLAYGILLPGPRLDEGVPYLGAGDVRPDRLRLDALPRTTREIAAAYPRTRMRAGELVYAIRVSFGNVEVIPSELDGVNLSRDAARLAPRWNIDAFGLAYVLKSRFCQQQFKLKEIGATITGVNIRDLKRIVLPFPPRREQAALALFLDRETSATNAVMGRAHREISLLREFRTRLIADVVTGKFDVREAAELPDEPEEAERLDEADALTDGDEDAADDLNPAPEEGEA